MVNFSMRLRFRTRGCGVTAPALVATGLYLQDNSDFNLTSVQQPLPERATILCLRSILWTSSGAAKKLYYASFSTADYVSRPLQKDSQRSWFQNRHWTKLMTTKTIAQWLTSRVCGESYSAAWKMLQIVHRLSAISSYASHSFRLLLLNRDVNCVGTMSLRSAFGGILPAWG
jgi:hypothetical protein